MVIQRIINHKIDFELAEKRLKANPAIEKIYKRGTFWMIQTVPLWIRNVNLGRFDIKIKFKRSNVSNFGNPTALPLYCKKPIAKNWKEFEDKFDIIKTRNHILLPWQSLTDVGEHKKIRMGIVCKGSYHDYFHDADKYGDLAKAFFWIVAAMLAEDDAEAYTSLSHMREHLNVILLHLTPKEKLICFGKDNQKKMNYDTFMKTLVKDRLKFKNKIVGNDLHKFIGIYKKQDVDEGGYCEDCGDHFNYLNEDSLCNYCSEKLDCSHCDSFQHPDDMYFSEYDDSVYCKECWDASIPCYTCKNRLFKEDERFAKDGHVYCEECWHDEFSPCEVCAEVFKNEELDAGGLCENCFQEDLKKEIDGRKRKSKFRPSVITKVRYVNTTSTSA